MLVSMIFLSVVAFFVTIFTINAPHPSRLIVNAAIIFFLGGLYVLNRYGRYVRLAGLILTVVILSSGVLVTLQWGMLDPDALLLFSLGVVVAGILVGARYSLYATCLVAITLSFAQHGEASGALHPDLSWLGSKPFVGDVVAFSAILLVIALVSWLFNRQMELSLRRARRSEKALARQRDLLETKAEKRAQQLAAAQLEQLQELYRFAELGRLSTALFHDLANHLSTVSLDIEGLSGGGQADITRRISQNIGHIDAIVQRVRQQLRGQNHLEVFNILHEIDEVLKILQPMAEAAAVTIILEHDKSVKPSLVYEGGVIRFRQIIHNLLSNAIEAYPAVAGRDAVQTMTPKDRPRTVELRLKRKRTTLHIQVADHGPGIPAEHRAKIFNPFYTTKASGTGIGLFIVKQVVEQDFGGTLDMTTSRQGTSFDVSLPKSYYART
jgi:signal transduction histidine kinase